MIDEAFIVRRKKEYGNRDNYSQYEIFLRSLNSMSEAEKSLRADWLIQLFSSFEYYQDLLKMHAEYLAILHEHWARTEIQEAYPEFYRAMNRPVFYNLDRVEKPNPAHKAHWKTGISTGSASTISYNFNRGMDDAGVNEYSGMQQPTINRLNQLVGKMLTASENIRRTADKTWRGNDSILQYSGPIDWPSDVSFSEKETPRLRCDAGQPCPQAGNWWSPAYTAAPFKHFEQGEIMPNVEGSSYGLTIWYLRD